MANHKSALKRARQNVSRRMRNRSTKSRIKNLVKNLRLAVGDDTGKVAKSDLDNAKSAIDNAAKKGVIHRKTAARKISRLSKFVNTLNA